MKKPLIIHIPVIHKGYLDFFNKNKDKISEVFVIEESFLEELSQFKPDIASIDSKTVKDMLNKFGFENISVLSKKEIGLLGNEIMLVEDEVSRNLFEKYLKSKNVEWHNVFLRWDKSKVLNVEKLEDIEDSNDEFDVKMMQEAFQQSEKSADWWRQIGAVLVKDKNIILRTYNKDLPSDHTPYQVGEVRDLFNTGERPEMANTIHSEQDIIAQAAKDGISVDGASIYVTTFPCPICAKLIARSGIKKIYFKDGWSNFDAKKNLESAGISIIRVTTD